MKKQFLFATLALATMFTACSKEEELSKNEGGTPVNFVIGGIGARTVTDANYGATFDPDDKVGLFSTTTTPAMNNAEFGVSNNTLTSAQEYTIDTSAETKFYAYYPWVNGAASDNVTLTINADQTTSDGLNNNDLLVAEATIAANATSGAVTLNFDHVMSFVEVTFGENFEAAEVQSVTMNVKSDGIKYDFTKTEGDKFTTQGSAAVIKMFNATGTENAAPTKFWAIIPPQKTDANAVVFTITVKSGLTYSYKPTAGETFVSNTIRKIKLEIPEGGSDVQEMVFSVGSSTIKGWGTTDDETETPVDVTKNVWSVSLSEFSAYSGSSSLTNRSGLGDMQYGTMGATVTVDENSIFTLTGLAASPNSEKETRSWYNNTLYFNLGTNCSAIPGQKYKVSVEFKPEAIVSGEGDSQTTTIPQMRIVVCNKEQLQLLSSATAVHDVLYLLDYNESAVSNTSLKITSSTASTEKYTTIEFIVDPYYCVKGAGSVSASNTIFNMVDNGNFVIALSAWQTNNATFYIKNITVALQE